MRMKRHTGAARPLDRLRGWLSGGWSASAALSRMPPWPQNLRPPSCHACPPELQLMALSDTLDAEQARHQSLNLVLLEQTLRAALHQAMATVPAAVLARSIAELRALGAFSRSNPLKALHQAAYAQALRNERALGAASQDEDFFSRDFEDTGPPWA